MKRIGTLLVAASLAVVAITGVAVAASSPTVATDAATAISNSSATLNATVNPNGNDTGYSFQYGVTNAYGQATNSHSAGGGTTAKHVHLTITHLTPGTTYHFHVVALSKAGSAVGADRTFTTHGPPPAAVVTGPAVNVRKTVSTVTGSVDPEGADTTWAVQYGLTTSYGVQTFPQLLPKLATSLPVSVTLSGLAPATLFHYRIVAYHGGSVVSQGLDQTFFTEPARRPASRLTLHTNPSRDHRKPYSYTSSGTLSGASFIPSYARCSGSAKLTYYVGKRRIGVVVAPVGPDCKFTAQNTFRHLHAPASVRIAARFNGNGYLAPVTRDNTVKAG